MVAGAVAWAASLIGAAAYLVPLELDQWSGARFIPLWSLIPAFVVTAAAPLTAGATARAPRCARGLLAVGIGTGLGLVTFAMVAALRGGWVAPVPVFTCWAYGAALGCLTVVATPDRGARLGHATLAALLTTALLLVQAGFRRLG